MIIRSLSRRRSERFSRFDTVRRAKQSGLAGELLRSITCDTINNCGASNNHGELEDRIYKYWLPPFLKRLRATGRRRRRLTALAALFLTTVGLVVIVVGLYEKWYDVGPDVPYHYFTLFLLGFITFVPGVLRDVQLVGRVPRWPQFEYDQVPSWTTRR